MKIDKAIEILIDFRREEAKLLGNEFSQATALGIEALKSVLHSRDIFPDVVVDFLPGESKE